MSKDKLTFLLAVALLLSLLTACGGNATSSSIVNTQPPPGTPLPTGDVPVADPGTADVSAPAIVPTETPAPTEALAAVVNGQPITLSNFQGELRRQESYLGAMPADSAAFEASVLTTMIDQVLIEQAAAVQGISVTDAEVDAEIAVNIEQAGSNEAWQLWLQQNLYTAEEYRASVRSTLITARIRDQVLSGVPDAVEQVHARHILVSTQTEADTIYQQLLGGADFGQLAFEHSRDVSTRDLGGDLGWFVREMLFEPTVAEVAFTQEIGAISQPVQSRLGYHIIQTLERVADRPLDETSRAALDEVVFERWVESLRQQATVQRFVGS